MTIVGFLLGSGKVDMRRCNALVCTWRYTYATVGQHEARQHQTQSGPPYRLHVLDQGQEEVRLAALGQRLYHAVQRLRARRHPAVLHALQHVRIQRIITGTGANPF